MQLVYLLCFGVHSAIFRQPVTDILFVIVFLTIFFQNQLVFNAFLHETVYTCMTEEYEINEHVYSNIHLYRCDFACFVIRSG